MAEHIILVPKKYGTYLDYRLKEAKINYFVEFASLEHEKYEYVFDNQQDSDIAKYIVEKCQYMTGF